MVVAGATKRTTAAPTFNSVAMTMASSQQAYATSPEVSAELWYLLDPPVNASYTVSIPNSGLTLYANLATFIAGSGYTSKFDSAIGATGSSANPTANIALTYSGEAIYAVMGDGQNNVPTAQTGTSINRTDDGTYSDNNQYYLQNKEYG